MSWNGETDVSIAVLLGVLAFRRFKGSYRIMGKLSKLVISWLYGTVLLAGVDFLHIRNEHRFKRISDSRKAEERGRDEVIFR